MIIMPESTFILVSILTFVAGMLTYKNLKDRIDSFTSSIRNKIGV